MGLLKWIGGGAKGYRNWGEVCIERPTENCKRAAESSIEEHRT